jgi:hypothetical protein
LRINGGFQVSKIKQLGDRIFEKIMAAGVYISVKDTLAVDCEPQSKIAAEREVQ